MCKIRHISNMDHSLSLAYILHTDSFANAFLSCSTTLHHLDWTHTMSSNSPYDNQRFHCIRMHFWDIERLNDHSSYSVTHRMIEKLQAPMTFYQQQLKNDSPFARIDLCLSFILNRNKILIKYLSINSFGCKQIVLHDMVLKCMF